MNTQRRKESKAQRALTSPTHSYQPAESNRTPKTAPSPSASSIVWKGSERVKNKLAFGTFLALLSPAISFRKGWGWGPFFRVLLYLLA